MGRRGRAAAARGAGCRSLAAAAQPVTQRQSPPEVNAETSRQRSRRVPVEPRYEQRVARMQLSLEAGGGGEEGIFGGAGGVVVCDCAAGRARAVGVGGGEGVERGSGAGRVAADAFAADHLDEKVVPRVVMKGRVSARGPKPRKHALSSGSGVVRGVRRRASSARIPATMQLARSWSASARVHGVVVAELAARL